MLSGSHAHILGLRILFIRCSGCTVCWMLTVGINRRCCQLWHLGSCLSWRMFQISLQIMIPSVSYLSQMSILVFHTLLMLKIGSSRWIICLVSLCTCSIILPSVLLIPICSCSSMLAILCRLGVEWMDVILMIFSSICFGLCRLCVFFCGKWNLRLVMGLTLLILGCPTVLIFWS